MRILFIDCYDSFTYNLVHLLESNIHAEVLVVHNDRITQEELYRILPAMNAVLVGPGPGHPARKEDSGIIDELWKLPEHLRLPILGICFGHQSLALAYGGEIAQLPLAQHGQLGKITHSDSDLFAEIPQAYSVVRYHSLYVKSMEHAPDLRSIAHSEDGVIMAVKHASLPYYGVQFHPESILSTFGPTLMKNFWHIACKWNNDHNNSPLAEVPTLTHKVFEKKESLYPSVDTSANTPPKIVKHTSKQDPLAICESLKSSNKEFALMHSAAHPGEWTIIALLNPKTTHLRTIGAETVVGPLDGSAAETQKFKTETKEDAWSVISDFMSHRSVKPFSSLPFSGGLIGYVTYEVACGWMAAESGTRSGISFVYVEDCILIDLSGSAYCINNAIDTLNSLEVKPLDLGNLPDLPKHEIKRPQEAEYIEKVKECQTYLASGDSYELCLTDETTVTFDQEVDPWLLFKHLVHKNPAPYATYFSFDDTLVGASPERYMSWDTEGLCQFRPIKGTVKKAPGVTREIAEGILESPKEISENLMIVDLIRHDIGQLVDTVTCPSIMQVEEYAKVYQLVSVIEGRVLPKEVSGYHPIDLLVHSLAPGSMTGAPKIRSVEILKTLERRPRGIYSGIAGYWSIENKADWCVVIRSAFKHASQSTWRIGAGGAVVILSDALAEFQEMEAKLTSCLHAFTLE